MDKLHIEGIDFWGEHSYNKGGVEIYWSHDDFGFGKFKYAYSGEWLYVDDEYMGKDFAKEVLSKALIEIVRTY